LALNVRNEEGRDQVLDKDFGPVLLVFDLIKEVVDVAHLKLSLLRSLLGGSIVNSLGDDGLQVAID